MIIYIENNVKNLQSTKDIIKKFPKADILEIENYKNIFDKNIWYNLDENILILAESPKNIMPKAPDWYWFNTKHAYFLKTSLNCLFDCKYCYLKWMFKNNFPVIFVDYDNMKEKINKKIKSIDSQEEIAMYISNYSDLQAFDALSNFNKNFLNFFDKYPNLIVETRTKSSNINSLLELDNIPTNTEIAFSLNPQIIIDNFEYKTSSLEKRIEAINKLLTKWFKVWIRFLPLIPYWEWERIYEDFLIDIKNNINMKKINSIFVWWLLYTESDFKIMKNKFTNLNFEYEWWMYKINNKERHSIYDIFEKNLEDINYCFENNCNL